MLDPTNKDKDDLPLTIRAVFIIGPDKKLKLSLNYPASVGRNMDEIVRCVDALQLSAKHSVVSLPTAVALPIPSPYLLYGLAGTSVISKAWYGAYLEVCLAGAIRRQVGTWCAQTGRPSA